MNHELSLSQELGTHLSDGERALAFRIARIDPLLPLCEILTLDFTGVRISNSSFMNALISGILEEHGVDILRHIRFKGCSPVLRVMVESAVSLGLDKHQQRGRALPLTPAA